MSKYFNFSFKQFIVEDFWKRFALMFSSVVLMGVFVSFLVEVGWGTDPASFFMLNASKVIGLSLGTTEVILYGIMLVLVLIFGAHHIGFGTIANMTVIGYTIDFCRWVWKNIGFAEYIDTCVFGMRVLIFALALIAFVIVAAFYMNAKMGVAPYDALPVIISDAITKVPYFIIRIIFDLSFVFGGFLLGKVSAEGQQGSAVGSIIISLLLGPTVSFVGKMLNKKSK